MIDVSAFGLTLEQQFHLQQLQQDCTRLTDDDAYQLLLEVTKTLINKSNIADQIKQSLDDGRSLPAPSFEIHFHQQFDLERVKREALALDRDELLDLLMTAIATEMVKTNQLAQLLKKSVVQDLW